jgi:hypothetical protein
MQSQLPITSGDQDRGGKGMPQWVSHREEDELREAFSGATDRPPNVHERTFEHDFFVSGNTLEQMKFVSWS